MCKKTLSFLLAIFLVGCVEITPTPIPSNTPTPIITYTPTPSETPGPTNTPTSTATPTLPPTPTISLFEKFNLFPWVDYAPTNYVPSQTLPSEEQIRADLEVLYNAGFRGLVTYSASDIFADVPRLAHEAGFEGIVMGIWMPGDKSETQAALEALPYVDGYVIGNEGLTFDRYDYATLEQSVIDLRQKSTRPVTTTEVNNLYFKDEKLLNLGDWIFPNAHPYWQNITDPIQAVGWTQDTFNALNEIAGGLPVILKEVGLPTEGAPRLSEYQQAEY